MKPHQKLQRYWRANCASQVETVEQPPESIERLETRYGIRLPPDFREYLLHACPKDNFAGDWRELATHLILADWWPLERIKNLVDEYEHPITDAAIAGDAAAYIFFADYAVWCGAWAINCGDSENRGRVIVISPDTRIVADSFDEFVDRYIEDPRKMY